MPVTWQGVVKVQRNLFSSHAPAGTLVLITSREGDVRWEGPLDPTLAAWFDDEHKFYAHAELRDTLIHLTQRARWQDW